MSMRLPCLSASLASTFTIPVEPTTSAPPAIPVGFLPNCSNGARTSPPRSGTWPRPMRRSGLLMRLITRHLTLSATGGMESSALKNLLDWPSRFWSVGPSISETVYDGGLRRATVNQYIATYNANVAAYRQSVLTAFQQVEDALAEVRILSQQIRRNRKLSTPRRPSAAGVGALRKRHSILTSTWS
jgi:hypothetical protein